MKPIMKVFTLTENEMIMMFAAMAGITVGMKPEEIADRLEKVGKTLKEYGLDDRRLATADFMNQYYMPLGEPKSKFQMKVQNLAELQAETFEFLEPEPVTPRPEDNDINYSSDYEWLRERIGMDPLRICEHFNFNIASALKCLIKAGKERPINNFSFALDAYQNLMEAAFFCKREAEKEDKFIKSVTGVIIR